MLSALGMSVKFGISKGIFAGLIFGTSFGVLAALLILLDFFLTRDIPTDAVGVQQTRDLQVRADIDQVFQAAVGILREQKTIKSLTPFREELVIKARTKASWASLGESVVLRFENASPGAVKIQITSRPVYRFTLIDYGKNFHNAEAISQAIRTRLAAS